MKAFSKENILLPHSIVLVSKIGFKKVASCNRINAFRGVEKEK